MITHAVKLTLLAFSCAFAQSDRTAHSNVRTGEPPLAQQLWKLDIRRNEPARDFLGPRIVSDQARVFYLQGGQVKAVDASTGRQLWTYHIGKWAQLRYSSSSLFAITYNGEVVVLEPQTSRVRWRKKAIYANLTAAGDTLYAADPRGVEAFDLTTGQSLWHTSKFPFSPTGTVYNDAPLTVVGNALFIQNIVFDAMSTNVRVYSAETGKFLLRTSSFGPVGVTDRQVFFVSDFPAQLDYPDRINLEVYDSRTSKMSERVYSVKGRVRGQEWNSGVAVTDAVYISGGGNLACFALSAPGGKTKPNFIKVLRGDVQWLAGPRNGTFLLEWQNALWLARQKQQPCTPVALQKQGVRLGAGKLARTDVVGDGMYISLKNGTFYAVDTRTGQVVLRLALHSFAFGPTHVIGSTLIIQAGNKLLAYPLPKTVVRYFRTR